MVRWNAGTKHVKTQRQTLSPVGPKIEIQKSSGPARDLKGDPKEVRRRRRGGLIRPETRWRIYWTNVSTDNKVRGWTFRRRKP